MATKTSGGAVTFLAKAARERTRGALPEATTASRKVPVLPESVREAYESLDAGEYMEVASTQSQGSAIGSVTSWQRAAEYEGHGKDFFAAMRRDGDGVIRLWVGRDAAAVKERKARLAKAAERKAAKSSQ